MKDRVIEFCNENKIIYENQRTVLNGIDAELIKITTKKLFSRAYDLFFINSSDLECIENIVKQLAYDKHLKKDSIVLFCSAKKDIDEKYCFYFAENMSQCVYCVYRNDITDKYSFYTDTDTPKLLRSIIKYVVKQ